MMNIRLKQLRLRYFCCMLICSSLLVLITSTILPAQTTQAQTRAWNNDQVVSQATNGLLKRAKGKVYEPSCNEEVAYDTEVIDLNNDGQPEVFTSLHSICLGGQTGVQLDLYIKNKLGKWVPQFGFPGVYTILKTKNKGFPDIEIGGPGNCFPIWRWSGIQYNLYKKCER